VAAAGHASLDPPDDILLGAVLAKHFNDRQVKPRPDVIPYLITHMERSFASAQQIVSALDAASIARKKPITRALAVETLDNEVRSGG
jgi:chromosomal replication initiation ATPase DnaA